MTLSKSFKNIRSKSHFWKFGQGRSFSDVSEFDLVILSSLCRTRCSLLSRNVLMCPNFKKTCIHCLLASSEPLAYFFPFYFQWCSNFHSFVTLWWLAVCVMYPKKAYSISWPSRELAMLWWLSWVGQQSPWMPTQALIPSHWGTERDLPNLLFELGKGPKTPCYRKVCINQSINLFAPCFS